MRFFLRSAAPDQVLNLRQSDYLLLAKNVSLATITIARETFQRYQLFADSTRHWLVRGVLTLGGLLSFIDLNDGLTDPYALGSWFDLSANLE